jgi:hypothetical protein
MTFPKEIGYAAAHHYWNHCMSDLADTGLLDQPEQAEKSLILNMQDK